MADAAAPEEQLAGDLLSDQVYGRIRQSIIDGELPPGQRLVESEIARRYRISQAPVRDAIKKLEHEGLVTYRRRRGNYVTVISPDEARQARQVRTVIEELAARELAGKLPPDDEQALMAAIDEMRAGARAGDPVRVRRADLAFHRKVCEATANPFIARVWTVLEPSLYTLNAIADPFGVSDLRRMSAWHERLLDALRDRDASRAARLFASHASAHGTPLDGELAAELLARASRPHNIRLAASGHRGTHPQLPPPHCHRQRTTEEVTGPFQLSATR